MPVGLRDAKRIETKERIIAAAVDLFLARGLNKTLVDDIAETANVSRRTFFNYFPSKEEVLSEWFRCQGEYLAACFASRPAEEALWASLYTAYLEMRNAFGRDGDRVVKLRRLLAVEPALMAKKYECVASTTDNLTGVVERRLPKTADRTLRAHVFVQAALGAYNSASLHWEAAPSRRSFEATLKRAFYLAEPKVVAPPRNTSPKP